MRRMEPAPIRWPRPTSSPWMRRCPQRRSEEHTSELQSQSNLVCRLLLEKKNNNRRQALLVKLALDFIVLPPISLPLLALSPLSTTSVLPLARLICVTPPCPNLKHHLIVH